MIVFSPRIGFTYPCQRGRGGTDTPDNLISLCLECHAEQPGHQRMRYSPDYQRFMDMRYG
ncbi:MAG: HNH endonuclease [Caldilineaceae bacterium]|nr:HNH endonuclease [Caldilineaceae bacterium]